MRVVAPARLHLGFLDLNGDLGRLFGSIGLAVDIPRTELVLKRSQTFRGEGPDHARAIATLHRLAEAYALPGAYEVNVSSAIPAHAGLGSGTQLALAAGAALMTLEGIEHSPSQLGELVNRGARSAIGMAAFEQGGFICRRRSRRYRPRPADSGACRVSRRLACPSRHGCEHRRRPRRGRGQGFRRVAAAARGGRSPRLPPRSDAARPWTDGIRHRHLRQRP
ncbi:MAG: hypothetical protein WDN31_15485 [Hyphomicrobium sp.]